MSKEIWNERFAGEEYIYGTEPNEFLRTVLKNYQPGRILFPAEGEGRNAVFAAREGWLVDAFDHSETGRIKALALAEKRGTSVTYTLSSLEDWQPEGAFYDCIALIFVHMPSQMRRRVHQKLVRSLKPGGTLLLQAFSKKQLPFSSGGPKDIDMLFDRESLKTDFAALQLSVLEETTTVLHESRLHEGEAQVINLIANKI
jgi:cyclopropane fatty-acyl-phospholipid synthase-like methyltransferase